MATKQTKFAASSAVLTLKQCVELIVNVGADVTVLVQGDMGSGKTSLLKEVSARTGMRGVYFDCTTKDLGDLYLPRISDAEGGDYVSFVPNEEFGLHHNEPVVLMLDEVGKNRSIMNGLLRVMQEHSVGSRALPQGSIAFATTNLGAEGVGDMLPPQARNRIMVVRMQKPSAKEWMEWGQYNNIDPALLAAVNEFPQFLDSFTDVENPSDNPHIYDPRDATRTSFVTPRSLEKLSHVLKRRAVLGDEVVLQAGIGLVGAKAMHDIMTMVNLGDTLPSHDDIVQNPDKAKVPTAIGAKIMVAIRSVQRVEQEEFASVFKYMQRLPMETTALFATALLGHKSKGVWVSRQSSFTEFAMKNFQLFQK
jgi:hypothetical protein